MALPYKVTIYDGFNDLLIIVGEEVRRFVEKIASIASGVKPRMIRSMGEFIEETKA